MREALPIVFQDEHLVAVHKPAGLLVHRTFLDRHETRFAVQILRDQLGRHVFPAHRLDRGTSGVLLFTLGRELCARVSAQFENQEIEKRYLAVVRGHPQESGTIDHPLTRQFDDYEFRPVDAMDDAQAAVTRYRRLAVIELPHRVDRYPTSRYALLELTPETGRKHQIRRHLKHIAHPIIGDATYGKGRHNRLFQELFGCHRMLLACTKMRLMHPVSGRPLILEAPPAPDFAEVLDKLGWGVYAR